VGADRVGLLTYTERISDANFARFLAEVDPRKVASERHTHLSRSELKILRAKRAAIARLPKPQQPPPVFSNRQLEIAFAALADRTRNNSAAIAAEMSI